MVAVHVSRSTPGVNAFTVPAGRFAVAWPNDDTTTVGTPPSCATATNAGPFASVAMVWRRNVVAVRASGGGAPSTIAAASAAASGGSPGLVDDPHPAASAANPPTITNKVRIGVLPRRAR